MQEKSIWRGIGRGLAGRCPTCGKGHLFRAFLKIRTPCEVCAADNSVYPSDDFPPYLTILVVGHVLVPLLLGVDRVFPLSMWWQMGIWPPVAAILCLLVLPRMKGATVGFCWANDVVREEPAV
jgi:uncharacterized protein (DUF983 family)